MTRRTIARTAAAVFSGAFLLTGTSAHATIVYTSMNAFLATAGQVTTLDLTGTSGPTGSAYYGTSWTYNGVTFTGLDGAVIFSNDSQYGDFTAAAQYDGVYLEWQGSDDILQVQLPTPVLAVGFEYMGLYGTTDTFTISVPGDIDGATTGETPSFFGVVEDTPFSSFTIQDPGWGQSDFPTLYQLSYSAAPVSGDVPEPASVALLGAALAVLPLLRGRAMPVRNGGRGES